MKCYICDFELVMPSGIETIIACPNCKRNILTNGTSTEEISRLEGQILALTLVNRSQGETINMWKDRANKCQIEIKILQERLDRYTNGMDWDHETSYGSVYNLEKYVKELEEENNDLKEQLFKDSWDKHI